MPPIVRAGPWADLDLVAVELDAAIQVAADQLRTKQPGVACVAKKKTPE